MKMFAIFGFITTKLVKIIQALYYNNKCQVIHNSTLSSSFSVHTGVRQGCLLSPLIFSVVNNWIMRISMTLLEAVNGHSLSSLKIWTCR